MGYRRGYYRKDGSYVQGHTINSGKKHKHFTNKNKNKGCMFILILLLITSLSMSCSDQEQQDSDEIQENDSSDCRDTNCANYNSQAAAQAAYEADPECRGDLDADKDGIACEEPGNTIKNCATTSNCGCSNKNKTPCQSDPCCRWIVGDGCKCN